VAWGQERGSCGSYRVLSVHSAPEPKPECSFLEGAFSLAVMDFNENVRTCPKKFFQAVEEYTREDRDPVSQGFSRERESVRMVKFIREGANAPELNLWIFQVRAAPW
jgi:hypothetical protein